VFELKLMCPQDQVGLISEALEVLDAVSVSVEDADARTSDERALYGEPGMVPPREAWDRSLVSALFMDETSAQDAERLLKLQDFVAACSWLGLHHVPDQDWVRWTQSQFEPVAIAPGFWVVPSWHEPPQEAGTVLRLDPGLAFGTGNHPTTRMCLRWLTRHNLQGLRVLDYGCGSGILAIAAAKLGARSVDAVDVDAVAIEATRQNAQANNVLMQVGSPELAQGAYDVVLANILSSPLKVLAPLLVAHVAAGAHLVLAGILVRQANELKQAYGACLSVSGRPCCLEVQDAEEGWILMTALLQ
jgi:ribosomal protein L11 methyltransferase